MISLRRKWGAYLCHCSLPAGFESGALADSGAIIAIADGAGGLPDYAARLREAFAEDVVYACACTAPEALEAACEAVGIAPGVHPLPLRQAIVAVQPPEAAADKARRLVLGALQAMDARPPVTESLITVGGRVAVFADRPAGLELARLLPGDASVVVFLEGTPEAFGKSVRGVNWGRPETLTGRLGALDVRVAPVAGSDFKTPRQVQADQVVVIGVQAGAVRGRTGVHRLPDPAQADLQAVADAVSELTGTFSKPEHVRYDAAICAGGAADQQACGLCIPACPYDAIARDAANPLRIQVTHFACEGCGACASACPTSALRFTGPAPEELYARLAALLAPDAAEAPPAQRAIVFHCEQQGRHLLEWAEEEGTGYPVALLPVEVPCLRYVSDAAMLAAVRLGAAGVGLLGCEECPNGERALLLQKLELARTVLDAFGLGSQRVRLLTVAADGERDGLQAVRTFAEQLGPAAVPPQGPRFRPTGNREVLADAIGAFIAQTGKEVGGVKLAPEQPFAFAHVKDTGCTLCRACATVCPTHAFAFDIEAQQLRFKHIACIGCGLCERVCPEQVITLRRELYLERNALDYLTVAEDEMVRCARCEKPYINRRALETVVSRVRAAAGVLDTFSGKRADLLRMCPDCRGVAAMLEVEQGWTP